MKHQNDKQQYASCLVKVPIFNHLNNEDQQDIVDLIKVLKVKKDESVYNAGTKNPSLYILHSGKVKISRYNENGDEQVFRVLMPGDFIGEHALFDSKMSEDFAISLEDSTLCVLNGDDLKEHMLKKPTISFKIINELNNRLLQIQSNMEKIVLSPVKERVAISILELSNNKLSFTLPFSKINWASMLGMSKETLSRTLTEFRQLNVIKLSGQRGIEILNKDYLKKLT